MYDQVDTEKINFTSYRDEMVIFGGLQKQRDVGFFQSSNDIWIFSIPTKTWRIQPTGSFFQLPYEV
jgi:hypothetical protein